MNFDKILESFSPKIRDKLNLIISTLEEQGSHAINEEFEKDSASTILSVMEEVGNDEDSIMKVSYVLANVLKSYVFDERIQKAVEIFCELQIPSVEHDGHEFILWNKAKEYLLMFLDDEELDLDEEPELELDLD